MAAEIELSMRVSCKNCTITIIHEESGERVFFENTRSFSTQEFIKNATQTFEQHGWQFTSTVWYCNKCWKKLIKNGLRSNNV